MLTRILRTVLPTPLARATTIMTIWLVVETVEVRVVIMRIKSDSAEVVR
jgi:hypothetical protein